MPKRKALASKLIEKAANKRMSIQEKLEYDLKRPIDNNIKFILDLPLLKAVIENGPEKPPFERSLEFHRLMNQYFDSSSQTSLNISSNLLQKIQENYSMGVLKTEDFDIIERQVRVNLRNSKDGSALLKQFELAQKSPAGNIKTKVVQNAKNRCIVM